MYRIQFTCLLLAICGITTILTLPQGAPESVCHTMLPFHGGGIPPAASRSPFRIVPHNVFINQGKVLIVEIEPQVPELTFGGFMIHARSISPPYQVVSDLYIKLLSLIKRINCNFSYLFVFFCVVYL